ncbi:Ig-like domain-containing protein, partial [Pseudomonas poae]|uniref:Ig-like domain-containing protein n=1 Tax=Pseudomonas poae TaxID=200451 RepID=UPI001C831386
LLGQAQVDGNGDWTFTPTTELDDGLHEFTATFTDPAGNTSAVSAPWKVSIDTNILTQVVITSMSKDSGADSNDFITNDGTAGRLIQGTLTGALKTDEKVQVSSDGGGTWQDAVVNDDAIWSAVDKTGHSEGWVIQARIINASGGTSFASQSVVLDTAVNTPNSVSWDGSTIEVAFDGVGLVSGDRLYLIIDGEIIEYGLSKAEITAGKAAIAWSSAEYGNGESISAALVDLPGNISDFYRRISKLDTTVFTEDFSDQTKVRFSVGDKFSLDNFNLTVVSLGAGAYKSGFGSDNQSSVSNPPGSMALELAGNGSEFRLDLTGSHLVNILSFSVGDLTTTELLTAVFYDQDGVEVYRTTRTKADGLLTEISYELPYGLYFSSVSLNVTGNNAPYIWIDDMDFGYQEYRVVSGEVITSETNQVVSQESVWYYGGDADNVFSLANVDLLRTEGSGINGGAGMDMLNLTGAGQVLDLTVLGNKIVSLEVIDLTGSGGNTLNLSLENVLNNGRTNLFHDVDTIQMMVKGNAGDMVNLDGLVNSADSGEWLAQGTLKLGVTNYQIYQHSTLAAELLVQQGMQTNLV